MEDDGAGVGVEATGGGGVVADPPSPEDEGGGGDDGDEVTVEPYSLRELESMLANDDPRLKEVADFRVCRPGFGALHWPGKTDVSDVVAKLKEVVRLEHQKVRIYEGVDGVPMPPAGMGLNKPCRYTMHNVWPRDNASDDVMRDARSVATLRAKLMRQADAMQAKMLNYDHQKGEWTIEVAYFANASR